MPTVVRAAAEGRRTGMVAGVVVGAIGVVALARSPSLLSLDRTAEAEVPSGDGASAEGPGPSGSARGRQPH